MQEEEKKH